MGCPEWGDRAAPATGHGQSPEHAHSCMQTHLHMCTRTFMRGCTASHMHARTRMHMPRCCSPCTQCKECRAWHDCRPKGHEGLGPGTSRRSRLPWLGWQQPQGDGDQLGSQGTRPCMRSQTPTDPEPQWDGGRGLAVPRQGVLPEGAPSSIQAAIPIAIPAGCGRSASAGHSALLRRKHQCSCKNSEVSFCFPLCVLLWGEKRFPSCVPGSWS